MRVDVGDSNREYGRTWGTNGALVDPATISLELTEPDGTSNTYTWAGAGLTREAAGVFYRSITWDQAGVWTLDWSSTTPDQTEQRYVSVGEPSSGVCDDWIGAEEVFGCAPTNGIAAADRNYDTAAEAASAASRILYLLSGRRYPGVCEKTERPCRRASWSETWLSAGGWQREWGYCGCGSSTLRECSCGGHSEIPLRPMPVLGVSQVKVDGDVVASSDYRVDDYGYLRRIDGDPWPSTQDLDLADTEDGTFSVTYFYGRTPPDDGILAAKRMAAELYQSCAGGECGLSDRVTSLVAQGVAVEFLDPAEFAAGRSGIREVDLFLDAERYGHKNLPTLTVSPDKRPRARRVGTA